MDVSPVKTAVSSAVPTLSQSTAPLPTASHLQSGSHNLGNKSQHNVLTMGS
ncbi:MAG: hypothetical protein GY805_31600 [Chloroflexi bacterium]|nr:hypothetical protein [Chloroflexota bacterium]